MDARRMLRGSLVARAAVLILLPAFLLFLLPLPKGPVGPVVYAAFGLVSLLLGLWALLHLGQWLKHEEGHRQPNAALLAVVVTSLLAALAGLVLQPSFAEPTPSLLALIVPIFASGACLTWLGWTLLRRPAGLPGVARLGRLWMVTGVLVATVLAAPLGFLLWLWSLLRLSAVLWRAGREAAGMHPNDDAATGEAREAS